MMNVRKKILVASVLLPAIIPALAQEPVTLTLDSVIDMAVANSNEARQAYNMYMAGQYDYSAFLASRKWQLNLNINPNLDISSISPVANSISASYPTKSFSTGATLNFEQLIGKTGGYAYATSNMAWSQFFGESGTAFRDAYGTSSMFGTTPIRVGYRQDLIGFNSAAWEKAAREKRFETTAAEYKQSLAQVSETAAGYFFDYASARALYEMYVINVQTADSLYNIGTRKYQLTAIRKDELYSLKLQLMNTQNSVRSSRKHMEQARQALLSYIGMHPSDSIDLVLPGYPDHLIAINAGEAVDYARRFNPVFGQLEEERINAERDVDKAKREKGLQINIDVSVGLQKYGVDAASFGKNNDSYSAAMLTFGIPLVDHGMRKERYNAALARKEYQDIRSKETGRVLSDQIINTVNELLTQQQMLSETFDAAALADESFKQNEYNYAQGLSDINTFTLAQNRKDEAHINYINALSDFWLAYYRLCSLTLYDFYNERPL